MTDHQPDVPVTIVVTLLRLPSGVLRSILSRPILRVVDQSRNRDCDIMLGTSVDAASTALTVTAVFDGRSKPSLRDLLLCDVRLVRNGTISAGVLGGAPSPKITDTLATR